MRVLPAGCVRKDGAKAALQSTGQRPDLSFPLIVEALARLRSKSCIIDGEALACDGNGMPTFDRIRYRGHDGSVFLYTFELIELNGDDLRTDPLEIRKATLANVLAKVVGERPSLERGIGQAPSYSQRPIMSCIQKPRL
jgi:ATP-dependent DNA ligase